MTRRLRDADYAQLLAFRTELRRFVQWSEAAAREEGLTPALHQLLLAIRGDDTADGPLLGKMAEVLHVRHHTVVELAQRGERAGLLERVRDERDHRGVHLRLTPDGEARLERLSALHLQHIAPLARRLAELS